MRKKQDRTEYNHRLSTKIYRKVYYESIKARWVQLLGGKCNRCGYSRCIGALDLHHIGQSKDECNHEYMRKGFIVKIAEGKIMLLCSNCHRELHYIEHHAIVPVPEKKLQ